MSDREKILRYYRSSGDSELAARLLDLAEGALRNRKYKVSDFLDPHGLSVAQTISAHYERMLLQTYGGYTGAEREKAVFIDEDFPGSVEFGISVVCAEYDSRYYNLSHRDVLGALLGLGLKREATGDIIMTDSGCQLIVDSAIVGFIMQNLNKIGAAPVSLQEMSLSDISAREEKTKEIRTTVASLRLDTIAAAGFGASRSKMAQDISTDRIKVNWQDAKNAAHPIKTGDIISMRGRGRVEVCEVIGQTKKGRFSIVLKRYL